MSHWAVRTINDPTVLRRMVIYRRKAETDGLEEQRLGAAPEVGSWSSFRNGLFTAEIAIREV